MKPGFLDCPQRYTRTPRTSQSGIDMACPIERRRPPSVPMHQKVIYVLFVVACGLVWVTR
jgi:hypothetical protein